MTAKEVLSRQLPCLPLVCAAVLWLVAVCWDAPILCRDAPNQQNLSLEEGNMTTPHATPTADRIHEVRLKYAPLFWRQPNVHGVGEGYFRKKGVSTETVGIVIDVTNKVDQSTLPPEDRIPDCLEGVPVQITEDLALEYPAFPWGSTLLPDKEEGNGSD